MSFWYKIFSYLPNPRVWKSLITANLCGAEVEVVGDEPKNLPYWLWDYDARELTEDDRANSALIRKGRRGFTNDLYKTDEFLLAHPFGTVPAAFDQEQSQVSLNPIASCVQLLDLVNQIISMEAMIMSWLQELTVFRCKFSFLKRTPGLHTKRRKNE